MNHMENIIFGNHSVQEALNEKKDIDKILINMNLKNKFNDLASQARKDNVKISYVPVQKFKKYDHLNHQGIIAEISDINYADFEETVEKALEKDEPATFLLLDGITDVRNLGAILRTAECTNVSAVILPTQGSAKVNSQAIKTSAGAAYKVNICKVNHLKDAIFYLQSSGVKLIGATEKANQNIYDTKLTEATAFVMGSEENGIHHSIVKMLDETAKIPLLGEINSLNVSVACGMFLYENLKQKLNK